MSIKKHGLCVGALASFLLTLLLGLRCHPAFLYGELLNPDSAMRLVRLQAMLQSGTPLSVVARDGGAGGTLLHWSHLLDSLLLAIAAPVAALTGWHRALVAAAMLFGPLSMAALGAALTWAAAPFSARQWTWLPGILAALSAPVLGYGLPGVVHHHVLLAVVGVMVAGSAARIVQTGTGGLQLGAWAASGVWLSPESMPLSLTAICFVWFAWLLRPSACLGRNLGLAGLSLCAVTTAAWLVDPPAAGLWAVEQDRVSIVFVTLAAGTAWCGVMAWTGLPRWMALTSGGMLGLGWLAAFPTLLAGTYGLLPADVTHDFLDGISEMQPITAVGPAAGSLLPALIAASTLALLGVRRRSVLLLYVAACGFALVLGGAQHVRFSTYPAVFAAATVPVALTAFGATRWRTAMLAGALLLPLMPYAVPPSSAAPAGQPCGLAGLAEALAPYDGQTVLAGVNYTPELLWRTGARTVGSLYHRSPGGFMRLRAAWRTEPGAMMPPAVAATGATLVLACPREQLPRFISGASAPNLATVLKAGLPPPWLHRAGQPTAGGFVLYVADSGAKP